MQYDLILKGEVGCANFGIEQVDDLLNARPDDELNILIDSLGGSLVDGISIATALADHGNVNVTLRGLNASAATVASMGAKRIRMHRNGLYLVHKCSVELFDWDILNADQLREKANEYLREAAEQDKLDVLIAEFYAQRTGKPVSELLDLMKEDTWLTSEQALEYGFVDEILDLTDDDDDDHESPLNIRASVAARMAAAGIPFPKQAQLYEDRASERIREFFSRILNHFTNPKTLNQMNDEEKQLLQDLQDAVADLDERVKTAETAIADLQTAVAALQELPGEEHNHVHNDETTTTEESESESESEDENAIAQVNRTFARARQMMHLK